MKHKHFGFRLTFLRFSVLELFIVDIVGCKASSPPHGAPWITLNELAQTGYQIIEWSSIHWDPTQDDKLPRSFWGSYDIFWNLFTIWLFIYFVLFGLCVSAFSLSIILIHFQVFLQHLQMLIQYCRGSQTFPSRGTFFRLKFSMVPYPKKSTYV